MRVKKFLLTVFDILFNIVSKVYSMYSDVTFLNVNIKY